MPNSAIKLPFGLDKNNILVHITEVKSGKECNCVCPECHTPLIAAKGRKIQHHFKHSADTACEGGLESAIHMAAKKIILEKRQITLPECVSIATITDSRGIAHTEEELVVSCGTVINFDSVEAEVELHGMKADVLATKSLVPLMIEIFYRHKVDDDKKMKIVKANISVIEIDLSDLTADDVNNWESFWTRINDPKRIRWLYNAKAQNSIYRKLESQVISKVRAADKEYHEEFFSKQQQEYSERKHLLSALELVKPLYSKENILLLQQRAETHRVWKYNSKHPLFLLENLPYFVGVEVVDGDWIFNCDRRVWQLAFFSYFIIKNGNTFCIKQVDTWLNEKADCYVHSCIKIIGVLGRRYPELLPVEFVNGIPSSWRTLRAYFNYLCKLKILEVSDSDEHLKANTCYTVINKTPFGKDL